MHLFLRLAPVPQGMAVAWTVQGLDFPMGSAVAHLPSRLVGKPTATVDGLLAGDDRGPLALRMKLMELPDDCEGSCTTWLCERPTHGAVRVSYTAAADDMASGGHPPIALRVEGGGSSGQGRTFLALPPSDRRWRLALRWIQPSEGLAACSLGEGDLDLEDVSLEDLLDCYYVDARLSIVTHPTLPLSVYFCMEPGFPLCQAEVRHPASCGVA